MSQSFSTYAPSLTGPAGAAATVVPHDTTPLVTPSRAIYVGVAGDLAVEMLSAEVVVLKNTVAGAVYPLRARRVMATGTTASSLVALS